MLDKTINSVTYQGGEGRNVFPIPFPFLESGHIRAWIRDASGKKTALQPGTDYAVNRIAEGNGELVLQEQPLPGTSRLVISRLVPLTQEILFHNQGPNSPRAIEEAVDKLTMIAQQLQDGINDRVPFQEGSEEEAIGKTLANTVDMVRRMRGELTDAVRTIDAKAPLTHRHGISEIGALEKTLENMATADDLAAKRIGATPMSRTMSPDWRPNWESYRTMPLGMRLPARIPSVPRISAPFPRRPPTASRTSRWPAAG